VMTVETNAECCSLISLCECWRRVFIWMHLFHVKGLIYHTISEPEKKQYSTFTNRRPLWYCWKVIYVWFGTVAKSQVCLGIKRNNNMFFKWHVGLNGYNAWGRGAMLTVRFIWCSETCLWL
jgi:hypothetical protein